MNLTSSGCGKGSIFNSELPSTSLLKLYSKLSVGGEEGMFFIFSFISTLTSTVSPAMAKQQYDSLGLDEL